jgi:hypothetical protein
VAVLTVTPDPLRETAKDGHRLAWGSEQDTGVLRCGQNDDFKSLFANEIFEDLLGGYFSILPSQRSDKYGRASHDAHISESRYGHPLLWLGGPSDGGSESAIWLRLVRGVALLLRE